MCVCVCVCVCLCEYYLGSKRYEALSIVALFYNK